MIIPLLSGNKLTEIEYRIRELEKKLFADRYKSSSSPKSSPKGLSPLSLLSVSQSVPGVIPFKMLLELSLESGSENELPVILGTTEHGKVAYYDLFKAPHMLIGGTTESGKTVLLWSIIASLLFQRTPEEVRFIVVDPKRVDMAPYLDMLPHLLTPVITDVEKAIWALRWTVMEMENRYKKLMQTHSRNIIQYNEIYTKEKMPYIIFIIDEFADVLMMNEETVETLVTRLAQLSRAVGIHLIISSQRVAADIFTGMIKANIPTRIALSVACKDDSEVIIDMPGAELLQEPGDALFLPPDSGKPIRIHTPLISGLELQAIVQWIIKKTPKSKKISQSKVMENYEKILP